MPRPVMQSGIVFNKLAYGKEWTRTYEDFVKYDMKTRAKGGHDRPEDTPELCREATRRSLRLLC